MNIIDLLTTINSVLDQLTLMAPKIIAFCAATATLIPEVGAVGVIIHKIGLNFGKAANRS
jgi:hypothetical protein